MVPRSAALSSRPCLGGTPGSWEPRPGRGVAPGELRRAPRPTDCAPSMQRRCRARRIRRLRSSRFVASDPGPARLDPRSPALLFEAALLRRAGRLRSLPLPGPRGRLTEEPLEPLARRGAVLRLRAVRAAVDEEYAVGAHPSSGEAGESRLDLLRKGGGRDIEPQLDRRRHLVDVLSAGPGGADEALRDQVLGDHARQAATAAATYSVSLSAPWIIVDEREYRKCSPAK